MKRASRNTKNLTSTHSNNGLLDGEDHDTLLNNVDLIALSMCVRSFISPWFRRAVVDDLKALRSKAKIIRWRPSAYESPVIRGPALTRELTMMSRCHICDINPL